MIAIRGMEMMGSRPGGWFPPVFLWYEHYGYKERWNRADWSDPTMKRTFDEYYHEALDKGWWDHTLAKVWQEVEPRVLVEAGGNVLRRHRGGQNLLLEHLWPKLKMIVSIDFRINTTGMYSDYILPAAQHYEKLGVSMPGVPPPEHRLHGPRGRLRPTTRSRTGTSASCSSRSWRNARRPAA